MTDGLSRTYAELLDGIYDSLDRIVLNAYFRFAQNPAGFRVWWRQLHGTEDHLDNAHLMRLAGRFRRRVHAWALRNRVPVRSCKAGEHKYEIAEQYRIRTSVREGVFLIVEGRAQAPVFDVFNSGHIAIKQPYPYVNHFSFYILDPEWGQIVIKLSGHPPFPVQIILNGHEYVARQAERSGFAFRKEGNCFTDAGKLNEIRSTAETLLSPRATGLLTTVCDRWIYKACLCFALDSAERQRSRFRYEYSAYQLEYSRNLLFRSGAEMTRVMEALVDRNRSRLDVKRLKTILGRKTRPHRRGKRKPVRLQVTVERLTYDLTIFKVYCGKVALKIYTKGERVLRAEAIAIDARQLGCGRDIQAFARMACKLKDTLERFLNVLACMDRCFVGTDRLEQLSARSTVCHRQACGIDLNRPRMRRVARAILALSVRATGFSVSEIVEHVRKQSAESFPYSARQAAYDLQKFRSKELVQRATGARRYQTHPAQVREISALLLLREQILVPLLSASVNDKSEAVVEEEAAPLDQIYMMLHKTMRQLYGQLGFAGR